MVTIVSKLDKILASKFNKIFYEYRPLFVDDTNIEENLISSYLAPDISLENIKHDPRKAVFASFANYISDPKNIFMAMLYKGYAEYKEDICIDPVVIDCLRSFSPKPVVQFKQPCTHDPVQDIAPNNTAIMCSTVYKELFANKNLLEYVSDACDARDLKALCFIDYMFRSTRKPAVQDILNRPGSLESKASDVTAYVIENHPQLLLENKFDKEIISIDQTSAPKRQYGIRVRQASIKTLPMIAALSVLPSLYTTKDTTTKALNSNESPAQVLLPMQVTKHQTRPIYHCNGEYFTTIARRVTGSKRNLRNKIKQLKAYNIDYNISTKGKRCYGKLLVDPQMIKQKRWIHYTRP